MKNTKAYYGKYGGRYVPEILMPAIIELEKAFDKYKNNKKFNTDLRNYFNNYLGRPTPLYFAKNLTKKLKGPKIYLKREDLNHTGSHKINNAIGQILLAKRMGKQNIIAETGAGQHGVATATAAALFNMKCTIYMGEKDIKRQALNVFRMKLLGATVKSVKSGGKTLKDAVNDAMRCWITDIKTTHYLLGSALGPHPYPAMVKKFQSIIGNEAKSQIKKAENTLPAAVIACVGGGSNSIGIFNAFIKNKNVRLIGVEAGGLGIKSGKHAARFADKKRAREGVLHGNYSYVLQDKWGQILNTHSISPGLDYSAVGPEHSYLRETKRAEYYYATDKQAINAFNILSKTEGIIPALESSHAVAYAIKIAKQFTPKDIVIINISGRGDKDIYNQIN